MCWSHVLNPLNGVWTSIQALILRNTLFYFSLLKVITLLLHLFCHKATVTQQFYDPRHCSGDQIAIDSIDYIYCTHPLHKKDQYNEIIIRNIWEKYEYGWIMSDLNDIYKSFLERGGLVNLALGWLCVVSNLLNNQLILFQSHCMEPLTSIFYYSPSWPLAIVKEV